MRIYFAVGGGDEVPGEGTGRRLPGQARRGGEGEGKRARLLFLVRQRGGGRTTIREDQPDVCLQHKTGLSCLDLLVSTLFWSSERVGGERKGLSENADDTKHHWQLDYGIVLCLLLKYNLTRFYRVVRRAHCMYAAHAAVDTAARVDYLGAFFLGPKRLIDFCLPAPPPPVSPRPLRSAPLPVLLPFLPCFWVWFYVFVVWVGLGWVCVCVCFFFFILCVYR